MPLRGLHLAAVSLTLGLVAGVARAQPPQPPTGFFGAITPTPSEAIPTNEGIVRGRVVDDRSGQPVPHATVLLVPTFVPGRERSVSVDERGRFEIRGITPGGYQASVDADGFLAPFRRQFSMETVANIDVVGGQLTDGVTLRLLREAFISGRIFDATGEGLPGATVDVLGPSRPGGRDLIPMSTARTDDVGVFRIVGLRPGEYLVRATPNSTTQRPDPERPDVYAQTYFPAAALAEDAQPLRVRAGQELFGIDFAMSTVEPIAMRGLVSNAIGGGQGAVAIQLLSTTPPSMVLRNGETGSDGSFHIPNVTPANYLLRAIHPTRGIQTQRLGHDTDWGHVEVVLPATTPIRGRLSVDTARSGDTRDPLPFDHARVGLATMTVPDDGTPTTWLRSTAIGRGVQQDGTFTLSHVVLPAVIEARILPGRWTVKSVHVNGRDVTYDRYHVRRAGDEVDIVLTEGTTELLGIVTDSDGRGVENCTVILFPATLDLRTRGGPFIRGIRPNHDGGFRIEGLPPIDYLVVAVAGLPQDAWVDPYVLERLWPDATSFRLEHGEQRLLQVELSSTPAGLLGTR